MKALLPLALLGIFLLPHSVEAATYNANTSSGATGGNWDVNSTWSPSTGFPGSSDLISINSLSNNWTVDLNGANRTVASLSMSATANSATFSGANTLFVTGNVTKTNAGTLVLGVDTQIGGTLTVSAGTLVLSGNNTITGTTTLGGTTATLQLNSAGALGTSALVFTSTSTIDNTSGAAMTLSGNNPITLGGTINFTGSHDLNFGTGAATFGTTTINLNGATGSTLTFGGILTNGANGNTVLTVNGVGNTVVLGGLATSQNTTDRFPVFGGTGNVTINGAVTDGGATAGGFSVNGSGIVTLMAASTYNGTTAVNSGVLNIRHGDALGTTSAGTTVAIGGTLQLQGGITTANESLGLRGTGAVGQTGALVNVSGTNNYAGLIAFGAAGGATISSDSGTLNLTNTGEITGGSASSLRPITLGGAGNGSVSSVIRLGSDFAGSLTKTGTGTWTLLAANTYRGTTTVSGGTLLINGNNSAATGNVSVDTGATLGGTGTVGGATTINGILSPGNSPGTLAFVGDLTINSGATYRFEGGDLVTVGGALDLNDNWTLSLVGGNFIDGGSTVIFTFGSLAASPDLLPTFDLSEFTAPFTPGTLSLSQVGNTIVLNGVSVIPEPSAALLFAIGFALLLGRRRFRRA